jgi:rRNA maturation endonuclease Nob1
MSNPLAQGALNQNLQDALRDLAQNQAQLQQTLADTVSRRASTKPVPYTGKRGEDARRFLASFNLWASVHFPNVADYQDKIRAAIALLEGDAAIWATPFVETINTGVAANYPWADWATFEAAFRTRFETSNSVADAKEILRRLRQGTNSVAQYTSEYKQYAGRTGYSDSDLRDKFYDGLSNRIKDAMVLTDKPTRTLDECVKVALEIDNRYRERDRERGSRSSWRPSSDSPNAPPAFQTQRDPDAMDVDASNTKSRFSFQKAMKGRCYGCGSREHRKDQGHHERDICQHCGMTGHRQNVCFSRYMGRPKGRPQRIAATEEHFDISASTSTSTSTPNPSLGHEDMILKLMESQKALAEQIEKLQGHF